MHLLIAITTTTVHLAFAAKATPSGPSSDPDDFAAFARGPHFVDKSLLARAALGDGRRRMVLAPAGWGKTANLRMLKAFAAVPVDSDGAPVNRNRTARFRAFKKLRIFEDAEFFFRHFGKHPVIHVELSDPDAAEGGPLTFKRAVRALAKRVHAAWAEHAYLAGSAQLNDAEKKLVGRWCAPDAHADLSGWEVQTGLSDLARFLFLHYECTEALALVDDCDSLARAAIFRSNEVELEHVAKLMSEQLVELLRPDGYVGGALVTGVSLVAGADPQGVSNLAVYRFLDDHPFVQFYGLTEPEAARLIGAGPPDEIRSWYNGYGDRRGTRLYNPGSLTRWLRSGGGEPAAFRNATEVSPYLGNAFAAHSIAKKIRKAVAGKSVQVKLLRSGSNDGVLMLRQLLLFDNAQTGVENVLFTYLFENGYFTSDPEQKHFVKVPNREVRLELERELDRSAATV